LARDDSTDLSSPIIQTLQPLFAKETNDVLLTALIDAFCAHITVRLSKKAPLDDKSLKLVASGLADKRAKIKTAWTVGTAHIIIKCKDDPDTAVINTPFIVFSKATIKPLFGVFNEVANNAVQATQAGTVIGGYAAIIAALVKGLQWQDMPDLGFSPGQQRSDSRSRDGRRGHLICIHNDSPETIFSPQREDLHQIGL
jgi:hypothetical protein